MRGIRGKPMSFRRIKDKEVARKNIKKRNRNKQTKTE